MKLKVVLVLSLVMVSALSCNSAKVYCQDEVKFYVSPEGSDKFRGTHPSSPFRTIQKARDAIRDLKTNKKLANSKVTVTLFEGTYPARNSMIFDERDSGNPDNPVIYRAEKKGNVRLLAGKEVENLRPLPEDKYTTYFSDPEVRKNIYIADLHQAGIESIGSLKNVRFNDRVENWPLIEFFINSEPMQIAAWPNDGWEHISGFSESAQTLKRFGIKRGMKTDKIRYSSDVPNTWQHTGDMFVHGYWYKDWADAFLKVASIDKETKTITIAPPQSKFGYRKGQRFRFLNVPEALDKPGEWYVDKNKGLLFLWSERNIEDAEVMVTINEEPVFEVENAENIRFENLTLEGGRSYAFHLSECRNVTIFGCTIRNFSANAVKSKGGSDITIENCSLYNLGLGGMKLNAGDIKTLTPSGYLVKDNEIHHFSRLIRTNRSGIVIRGVGFKVIGNVIHDAPHNGIRFSGNENLFESNEFYNLCLETNDAGALYAGRSWTQRGNVVRDNYFHDLPEGDKMDVVGLYIDDMFSGTLIENNSFENLQMGILIGGGRDNIVRNNYFENVKFGVHLDSRGIAWANERILRREGSWDMFGKLEKIPYRKPPYSVKYPELADILENQPLKAAGNKIINNTFCDSNNAGKWLEIRQQVELPLNTIKNNKKDCRKD